MFPRCISVCSTPQTAHPASYGQAREFYQDFVQQVRTSYLEGKVQDGVFGAMMDVSLVNDGPVTFIADSEGE
jgi:D-Tyr-tRNAtyr deacylase